MLDVEAVLGALNTHGVRFVTIGALAATLHGSPLRTGDIDICPEPSEENTERLARALAELAAREYDPHKDALIERDWGADDLVGGRTWLLVTRHGRLDLVYEPAGTSGYEDLIGRAEILDVDGLEVTVASLEDLIRMKEAAGRDQDLAQVQVLRRLLDRREA